MKNKLIFNRSSLWMIIIAVIFIMGWIIPPSFLNEFSHEQKLTILLLLFAVYLWIAVPIPTGASSLLILAFMFLLNLVDSVEEALSGFLTPALYFILVLSIISKSLVKVEVDQVVANLFIKISKGGPSVIIFTFPVIILLMPILLPSAVARFKMLLPLLDSMNKLYGFSDKSIFHKYGIFLIGMLNQNATIVIFTGGGFPVLAHQLLSDYQVANLGWIDWFLIVAPPLWVGSLVMVLFIWNYLKLVMPEESNVLTKAVSNKQLKEKGKVSPTFWIVLVTFLVMILAWIFTDEEKVPLLLPPMLLIAFYSIPKLGLVTNKMIREYDWENFLMLGASFSLGALLAGNGTAEAIANLLIGLIPENSGTVVKVVIIAWIIFVLRFFFIVPSAALVVIFPIVMSYSELIGLPTVQLAFLVILIVGSMMVLPIHTTTTYLAYETGIVSKKEQYIVGFIFSLFFMMIAIVSALYYW